MTFVLSYYFRAMNKLTPKRFLFVFGTDNFLRSSFTQISGQENNGRVELRISLKKSKFVNMR